jgi:hypothetical protein
LFYWRVIVKPSPVADATGEVAITFRMRGERRKSNAALRIHEIFQLKV